MCGGRRGAISARPPTGSKSLFQQEKSASPGARRRTRSYATPTGSSSSSPAIATAGAGRIAIDDLRIVPLPGAPAAARPAETSANDAVAALAKASPRGAYPRAFIGEQPYWTLAGSDGGQVTALISEDASIEPAKGSFRSSPRSATVAKQFNWADVEESQSLAHGRLPIPSVTWTAPGFRLDTTLLADSAGRAALAGYKLTNISGARRTIELRLGIRPWQVNPPAQFLAQRGGASPIARIVPRRRPAGDRSRRPKATRP